MVLQNEGGDDEIILQNGAYVFNTPILNGNSYNVTVDMQPDNPIQPCLVSNGNGTINNADVLNAHVICDLGTDLIYRHGFEDNLPNE